jgi:hypothetical protein
MRRPKSGGVVAGLLMVGVLTAACSSGTPAAITATTSRASTSTTDLTAAAAAAYLTAYNTMSSGLSADIPGQNSSDPTTSTNAINNEVTVLQTFDTAVQGIQLPSSADADAQTVLNADAALESALGTLAVNTNDVSNYNSVFDTVQPDETTATADQTALARDLGLTFSSSSVS